MKEEIKNSINQKIHFLKQNKDKLVIDADTHISDIENLDKVLKKQYLSTPNYYHGKPISAEDLLCEMKMAAVDMCLIWQNPAATVYQGNEADNFDALLRANRYIFETDQKYTNKFIPAGWTDPKALGIEKALELVDICVQEFGFAIMKFNPAQNQFPLDSDTVISIIDCIIENNAVPAFHYAADTPFTPVKALENIAKAYPKQAMIAIHMGGGGASYEAAEEMYNQTRELGLKYTNLRFIESAKRDTHIESDFITYQLAGEPFCNHIFCASDAPYGRQTWNFGGYRAMFKSLMNGKTHTDKRLNENPQLFNDAVAQKYLGGNLADFAFQAYTCLLKNN